MYIIEDEHGNKYNNMDICAYLNSAETEVSHLEYLLETLIGYDRVDYLLYLLYDTKDKVSKGDVIVDKLDLNDIQIYKDAQIALLNYLINRLKE